MPFITLPLQSPKTAAFKTGVLVAVQDALVHVGVPPTDRFYRERKS